MPARKVRAPLALRFIVVSVLGLVAAGCDSYLERREGISPTAGSAVRANIATHVIDPWPRGAANRNITLNSERLVTVVERAMEPTIPPPPPRAPASTTNIAR